MPVPARLLPFLLPAALLAVTPTLLADTFTPGSSTYTVQTTGVYQIIIAGAAGGGVSFYQGGGSGAILSGDFTLISGTALILGIGHQGAAITGAANGGGGSFVETQAGTLLLDAGAGGGAGHEESGYNASLTTSGVSVYGATGGANGADGGNGTGQGGGGFLGSGSTVGGNASGSFDFGGGGGGGGYSGGAGGGFNGGAGGGGSYYDAAAITALTEAVSNTGDGYATITLLQAAPTVTPEPSSLLLLGTGVLGFAGAIRRRFLS